jgi:GDP-L-fucose synthase
MSVSPKKTSRIFVAGHRGLVGSAILRRLTSDGFSNLLVASKTELDLRRQSDVDKWFELNRPEFVYLVAGKVGGIVANSSSPAEFLYDNIMIHANVIDAAHRYETTKLLYLGSSCIYPREAKQPIHESELLTGQLEPTNQWYAIAKISGLKMCEAYRSQYGSNFISAMPTNLYGPGDNFDLVSSHVIPAMIRKFDDAKRSGEPNVVLWGTGTPLREFLHVDDLAEACVFLMDKFDKAGHVNIGSGLEVSIRELADLVKNVVYPDCEVIFDDSKPDGTPRKLLECSRINQLGWESNIGLEQGIKSTYEWYRDNQARK